MLSQGENCVCQLTSAPGKWHREECIWREWGGGNLINVWNAFVPLGCGLRTEDVRTHKKIIEDAAGAFSLVSLGKIRRAYLSCNAHPSTMSQSLTFSNISRGGTVLWGLSYKKVVSYDQKFRPLGPSKLYSFGRPYQVLTTKSRGQMKNISYGRDLWGVILKKMFLGEPRCGS